MCILELLVAFVAGGFIRLYLVAAVLIAWAVLPPAKDAAEMQAQVGAHVERLMQQYLVDRDEADRSSDLERCEAEMR